MVQQQEGAPAQVLVAWILSREGQGPVTATLQTPTGVDHRARGGADAGQGGGPQLRLHGLRGALRRRASPLDEAMAEETSGGRIGAGC